MLRTLAAVILAAASFSSLAQEFKSRVSTSYQSSSDSLTALYVDIAASYQSEKTFGITARDLQLRQGDWSAAGVQVGIETSINTPMGDVTESVQITTLSNKTYGTGKISSSLLISDTSRVDMLLERSFVVTQAAVKEGITYTLAGGAITSMITPKVAVSGHVAGQYFSDGNLRGHLSASVHRSSFSLKYQGFFNSETSQLYYNPRSLHQVTAGTSFLKTINGWTVTASVSAGAQQARETTKPAVEGSAKIVSPPIKGATISLNLSSVYEGARSYFQDGVMKLGYQTSSVFLQLLIPLR